MALTTDAIFQPLNDFFTGIGEGEGVPARFRFDHLPKAFSEADFLLPGHPELGASPQVAQELFSRAVDGVVRLDGDGRDAWLGASRFSELYADEILGPATVFVPPTVKDPAEKQACMAAFEAAKAAALKKAQLRTASLLQGAGATFSPCIATPANWYDTANAGAWSRQSFSVTAPVEPAPPAAVPTAPLLRMKIADGAALRLLTPMADAQPAGAVRHMQWHAVLPESTRLALLPLVAPLGDATNAGRGDRSLARVADLPYLERAEVREALAAAAPGAAIAASTAEISFDYCVIYIGRPWYHAAFIDNGFWQVPGQTKGALSANNGHGQPALPVACVAIRRLRIRADWTPEDIGNLEQSAQFGPFNIDSTVKYGAIGHEGLQIIGWLLQDMPMLPPQGSDAVVGTPLGTGDIAGTWSDSDGFTYVFSQDGGDFSYSQRRDGAEVGTGAGRLVGGQLTYRYSSGQDAGTCTGHLGPDGDHIDGTCSSGGDNWKFGIWR